MIIKELEQDNAMEILVEETLKSIKKDSPEIYEQMKAELNPSN